MLGFGSMTDGLLAMLEGLESHQLRVELVPLNPRLRNWSEFGCKRVCSDVPPKWYRQLCNRHQSSRCIRRGKFDTKIRRFDVLRLLRRLVSNQSTVSKYADEIRGIAQRMSA